MSPQPPPSIIKVAPALDALDIISNETMEHSYRRSHEFDAFDVSVKRQDDIDQTDEEVDRATGSELF